MSKTNIGLVEYCKAQLGRPYWMGTFGQIATQSLLNSQRSRSDIKQYYTASDFPSQFGQRVHDCIGLVKGYMWSEGPDSPPGYAINGMPDWNQEMVERATAPDKKGKIGTMPEIPGVLVYFSGHVGVYIGGGEVIEARGHAYGVVKTKLGGRGWKTWGYCPYIDYVEEEDDMVRYKRLGDIPNTKSPTDKLSFRDIIGDLMEIGVIKGDESDKTGNNDVIDLSYDQVQNIVYAYRGGAFDRKLIAAGFEPVVKV